MSLARDTDVPARFALGANRADFLGYVEANRIAAATDSVAGLVGTDLPGSRVLDAGTASGLSSLAAGRLGADDAHSFDLDPDSVACTRTFRERYAPDAAWTVERDDLVGAAHVQTLGQFERVYCWGVAHHTGARCAAVDNVCAAVAPGRLVLSLYNDQGVTSQIWRAVKRVYNFLPRGVRPAYALVGISRYEFRRSPRSCPARPWNTCGHGARRSSAALRRWHDIVDWVSGYPLEVARVEDVAERCSVNGLLPSASPPSDARPAATSSSFVG